MELAASDYPDLFHQICSGRATRRVETGNPRVRILGLLESRLQTVDRIVLGGLSEGTWPPDTRSDPWLSRPMRLDLGLNLPELRVGLSAHDFAQGLGAPEVILMRPAKQGGAPTVSSRFLQRLAAVVGALNAGKRRRRAAQDTRTMPAPWITRSRFRPFRGHDRCPRAKPALRS